MLCGWLWDILVHCDICRIKAKVSSLELFAWIDFMSFCTMEYEVHLRRAVTSEANNYTLKWSVHFFKIQLTNQRSLSRPLKKGSPFGLLGPALLSTQSTQILLGVRTQTLPQRKNLTTTWFTFLPWFWFYSFTVAPLPGSALGCFLCFLLKRCIVCMSSSLGPASYLGS